MDRILRISIEPCKHLKFFPGLLTYSRWHPLRSLYLSSSRWGLLSPSNENALVFYTIFLFLCQYIEERKSEKRFAFMLSSHWIRKKGTFILICLFNSKVIFPVTKGSLKLGVIIAWCLLNPLLARAQSSDSLLTHIWRTLWNLCYDMPMSLEHLKNSFKLSPKNVETVSCFGCL